MSIATCQKQFTHYITCTIGKFFTGKANPTHYINYLVASYVIIGIYLLPCCVCGYYICMHVTVLCRPTTDYSVAILNNCFIKFTVSQI